LSRLYLYLSSYIGGRPNTIDLKPAPTLYGHPRNGSAGFLYASIILAGTRSFSRECCPNIAYSSKIERNQKEEF